VAAAVAALSLVTGAAPAGARSDASINKTDNVREIANFAYKGGTDLDFQGKYVYAGRTGDQGGFGIYDISGPQPKEVSFTMCPGSQNDVAVVKPGLLALGYHSGHCGGAPGAGVRLIDVRNPKKPRFLSDVTLPGGTHTLTVYPGKPIIYASPGGLANGGGTQQILDASNPKELKVAATFKPNSAGCHDVTFHFSKERKLAFCAGLSETQVWDVKDPLKPVTIGRAVSPSFFPHHAVATPDGDYLLITDEAFGAHDCVGGPTGSVWVYDITTPQAPLLVGHWGPQRGRLPVGVSPWCTAHNLNFVPDTRIAVLSWYSGGTSVVDFENPSLPKEIAYYQPSDANTWSSYWYRGRIYANDTARGLDVLEVDGLPKG
jgi:hypothetical protein